MISLKWLLLLHRPASVNGGAASLVMYPYDSEDDCLEAASMLSGGDSDVMVVSPGAELPVQLDGVDDCPFLRPH